VSCRARAQLRLTLLQSAAIWLHSHWHFGFFENPSHKSNVLLILSAKKAHLQDVDGKVHGELGVGAGGLGAQLEGEIPVAGRVVLTHTHTHTLNT
jgi:hypothetical protein